jgi:hypothetical protein
MSANFRIANMKQWKRDMREVARIMRKSRKEFLEWFGVRYGMSARNLTKMGKKFREIVPNPHYFKGSKKAKWAIVVRKQPRGQTLIPKRTKKKSDDRRVLIPNRGMAKTSWGWMLGRLGKARSVPASVAPKAAKRAKRVVDTAYQESRDSAVITLTNRLSYLTNMDPTLEKTAVERATAFMHRQADHKLQKEYDKKVNRT